MIQTEKHACTGCGTEFTVRRVQVSMKTGGSLTCPKCGKPVILWSAVEYFYQFEGPLPVSAAEIDVMRKVK